LVINLDDSVERRENFNRMGKILKKQERENILGDPINPTLVTSEIHHQPPAISKTQEHVDHVNQPNRIFLTETSSNRNVFSSSLQPKVETAKNPHSVTVSISAKEIPKDCEQIKPSVFKKIEFLAEPIYSGVNSFLQPRELKEGTKVLTPKKVKAIEFNYNSPPKSRRKNSTNSKRLKSCLKTPSPNKKRR
jgi:hypothetical protein